MTRDLNANGRCVPVLPTSGSRASSRSVRGGKGRGGRLTVVLAVASLAVVSLAGCSRDPLEESYDRWATAFNVPEEVGHHDADSLRTVGEANCDMPTTDDPPDERSMHTYMSMAAALMANCPRKGISFLQDRIDQGPGSGPIHDELVSNLAKAKAG